ncbi:hypothetical protein BMF94_4605 [Rhodotorula taiwanensis]|uniref:Purine-cytosine permease n=1 Tax=Rhodotorula taiwanensis TaxID=741276 RepID=A0A2S5B690_9BASI|nr:hypothetical protein BMF94_4605 [Rhodotorula taiwanensis]
MSISSRSHETKDIDLEEKGGFQQDSPLEVTSQDDGIRRESSRGFLGWLWKVSKKLDSYGVEVRGVERVPENDRNHPRYTDVGTLWLSANMTIATFSLGTLGNSVFDLQATDACLVILFFNLLCTLPVALFSCWGKSTGLRQMMLGRFSFGPYAIWFPIVLNALACIGWSTINTIVGASALQAVTDTHQLPQPVGIIIISLITLVIALFGYKYVHALERYASIPVFIIFMIIFGEGGKYMHGGFGELGSGEPAAILSFGGTIAGFALGWTSLAADYTVNFPVETADWKVFACTYAGLNFPLILIECLGALMMSTFVDKPSWGARYEAGGLGGLLRAGLSPLGGFGQFLLVILALSIVTNNIPNVYSFALTVQSFHKSIQRVPRFSLCILCTAIYIALAEAGYNSFESAFDTLLVILSYWLVIYSTILVEEHYIFRRGSFKNYNLERYNDNTNLPAGWAAAFATCCGAAGTVLGYTGVLGKKVGGPFGGDIGFEMACAFSAVTYPVARYFERRLFGR